MAYERFTIRQYMIAMFSDDRTVLSDKDLQDVYNEYIETSGLYDKQEVELLSTILYLNTRVNTVNYFLELQDMYIDEFGEPYRKGFKILKDYGYRIKDEDIIKQLRRIKNREAKYRDELKVKELELKKSRNGKKEIKQTRVDFIKIVNALGKEGYIIDWDRTTMEEFSVMISQQEEYNQKISNYAKRRR